MDKKMKVNREDVDLFRKNFFKGNKSTHLSLVYYPKNQSSKPDKITLEDNRGKTVSYFFGKFAFHLTTLEY